MGCVPNRRKELRIQTESSKTVKIIELKPATELDSKKKISTLNKKASNLNLNQLPKTNSVISNKKSNQDNININANLNNNTNSNTIPYLNPNTNTNFNNNINNDNDNNNNNKDNNDNKDNKDNNDNNDNNYNNKNNNNNNIHNNEIPSVYKSLKIERGLFVQGFAGDPFEKYEIISILGEGSYGKVYKVKLKDSEIYRAMKVIKKRYQYNNVEEEKIIKEIQILRKLDHPNIIKVFEFFNTRAEFYIISELWKTFSSKARRILEPKKGAIYL